MTQSLFLDSANGGGGISPLLLAMLMQQNQSQPNPFSLAPMIPTRQGANTGNVSTPGIPGQSNQPVNGNANGSSLSSLAAIAKMMGGGSGGGGSSGLSPWALPSWMGGTGSGGPFDMGGIFGRGGFFDNNLGISGWTGYGGNSFLSPYTDISGNIISPMSSAIDPTVNFTPDQLSAMGGSIDPSATVGGGSDALMGMGSGGWGDMLSMIGEFA